MVVKEKFGKEIDSLNLQFVDEGVNLSMNIEK